MGNELSETHDKKTVKKIIELLKKEYPDAGIALKYGNPTQLLVATMLSAQCTDKKVNEVTEELFKKFRTAKDFADVNPRAFESYIRPTGFYRAKAKNIIEACKIIVKDFGGQVPRSMGDLVELPGVARKTANIVLF